MATDGGTDDAPYPCPACGARLFGWSAARDPLDRSARIVIDRCESCGLAVSRAPEPPDVAAELEPDLERTSDGGMLLVAPNRRSIQGAIGGAQWAGLEPDSRRLHLNPRSAGLLLAAHGLEAGRARTPFGARSRATMVQTLLNAFTLRDNFLRNARAGRLEGVEVPAWEIRLDWAVSYLVLIPSIVFGAALEAVAALSGRGGVLEIEARPGADQPDDAGREERIV